MPQESKEKLSKAKIGKGLGAKNPNWRGGKIMWDGYDYIYSPKHPYRTKDKYVAEHRLVMEKSLNRILEPNEIVHHINGIPTDNRIENLVLCKSHGEHTKHHQKKRNKLGQFISSFDK